MSGSARRSALAGLLSQRTQNIGSLSRTGRYFTSYCGTPLAPHQRQNVAYSRESNRLVRYESFSKSGAGQRAKITIAGLQAKQIIADALCYYPKLFSRFRKLGTMDA